MMNYTLTVKVISCMYKSIHALVTIVCSYVPSRRLGLLAIGLELLASAYIRGNARRHAYGTRRCRGISRGARMRRSLLTVNALAV